MRLPDWSDKKQRWDKYRQFHIGVTPVSLTSTTVPYAEPPFVMFDSGEVIATSGAPNPNVRCAYPMLGVTLVATGDAKCPALTTADGAKVPKAWLNDNGQQYLLIDHDTGRAVRTDAYYNASPLVSADCYWAKAAAAYFAGPGQPPIGRKVALRQPLKLLPKETRQQLVEFECATRAAMMMLDHPSSKLKTHVYSAGYTWTEPKPAGKLPIERALEVKNWEDLTEQELKKLFFNGLTDRSRELVDYLLVAKD